MYSVQSAGKMRKTPMSASAGATNATARHRPSPTTSLVGPGRVAAAASGPATGSAETRVPAVGTLVRPADDRLHALRVAGRRVGRALPAHDVERRLLQRLRHPRVYRETGPERGQRQHLLCDEREHRVAGEYLVVDVLPLGDPGRAGQLRDRRVPGVHELQQFPRLY